MKYSEMKNAIEKQDKAHLVRELVEAGFETEEAVEYVFDKLTLTKEDFKNKYFR